MKTIALFILFTLLSGCEKDNRQPNLNILYSGQKWDIVRLNDSIVVCTPGLNAHSKSTPVVINLYYPDCQCWEKGESYD